jgi:hypothetical protein
MRIVLHIGSSKTGTTALQASLTRNTRYLRQNGVLYPAVRSHPISHHFMTMRLLERTGMGRTFRPLYKDRPDLLAKDYEANWRDVRGQVRKYRPHTLVLSSEILFRASDVERAKEFRDLLRRFSDDISIVAYLRQPSAFYLSGVQQALKSSSTFQPPAGINFRTNIEFYEALFGCRVNVAAFDRATLANGDIVSDFVQRYLPTVDAGKMSPELTQTNETLSAETMSILQDYRRVNHPDSDYMLSIDTARFRMRLQEIEHRFGFRQRPSLREGIGRFIDHASVDLLWLQESRGIVFPNIEYDRIGPVTDNPYQHCRKVADICEVDEARRQEIMMRVIREIVTPPRRMPANLELWLKRRSGSRTLRSIRDAVRAIKTRMAG